MNASYCRARGDNSDAYRAFRQRARVRVEPDIEQGSGLRGLADRVEAVGGRSSSRAAPATERSTWHVSRLRWRMGRSVEAELRAWQRAATSTGPLHRPRSGERSWRSRWSLQPATAALGDRAQRRPNVRARAASRTRGQIDLIGLVQDRRRRTPDADRHDEHRRERFVGALSVPRETVRLPDAFDAPSSTAIAA